VGLRQRKTNEPRSRLRILLLPTQRRALEISQPTPADLLSPGLPLFGNEIRKKKVRHDSDELLRMLSDPTRAGPTALRGAS
jgi:hypothetical protein